MLLALSLLPHQLLLLGVVALACDPVGQSLACDPVGQSLACDPVGQSLACDPVGQSLFLSFF
jgi:hypothetical protein